MRSTLAAEKPNNNRPDKGELWLRILNSSVSTTLITVVLGGIVGNVLVSEYQGRVKEHERLRVVNENNIHEGITYLQQAFQDAGAMIAAAENLEKTLTDPLWEPQIYKGEQAKRIEQQRVMIVDDFNTKIGSWQQKREMIALQVGYFLRTKTVQPDTLWWRTQAVIDSYLVCVKKCYGTHQPTLPERYEDCGCRPLKIRAWLSLRHFSRSLPPLRDIE